MMNWKEHNRNITD